MAQDPFQVDQVQIEPGSTYTILMRRLAATGSLEFLDGVVTGGITLSQLAGIPIANFLVVGKSGAGAEYTAIQSAADAVPASASAANPYVILVGPGQYRETVNIVRDGVFIIGFGATLQSVAEATPDGVGAYHTMVIQAGSGTIPRNVTVQGLIITNAHQNFACVRVTGGAASGVGSGRILFQDCEIQATSATGGRTIWADSVNNIFVQGGSFRDSGTLSLLLAEEVANFVLDGVRDVTGVQMDYDNGGVLPSQSGCEYRIIGCKDLGATSALSPDLASTLTGAGRLDIIGCTGGANLTMGGDQSVVIQGSEIGNLALGGTTAGILVGSRRGTISGATATLKEPFQTGTASFAAAATGAVAFTVPHPDANYHVSLEVPSRPTNDETPWVTPKAASGFTINFQTVQTMDVVWTATRIM